MEMQKVPRTTEAAATPQGSGSQALLSYLLARGQFMCTPMFEVGWVEFNFWLKGAFSWLNMDVLAGEQLQVEARFLSAAHSFLEQMHLGKKTRLFCA